ncbi:MAG: tetratricopeptide repeat protein [Myxococcota bacterium]
MPFRIGVFDLTAIIILLTVILIPTRPSVIGEAYSASPDEQRAIAVYQARLAAQPGDAEAATKLAELLTETGQTDWAVQVASEAAKSGQDMSWQSLLAVSIAHAERIEVVPAQRYAQMAWDACQKVGHPTCPNPEQTRLSVYLQQLTAGVESGIDPRLDPRGYQRVVLRAVRMVRVRGAIDDTPSPDDSDDKDGDSGESSENPDRSSGQQSDK